MLKMSKEIKREIRKLPTWLQQFAEAEIKMQVESQEQETKEEDNKEQEQTEEAKEEAKEAESEAKEAEKESKEQAEQAQEASKKAEAAKAEAEQLTYSLRSEIDALKSLIQLQKDRMEQIFNITKETHDLFTEVVQELRMTLELNQEQIGTVDAASQKVILATQALVKVHKEMTTKEE